MRRYVAPLLTIFGVGLLITSLAAQAEPIFARKYKDQYGYQPSCNACHTDGGGSPLNPYGKQYKAAGKNAAALTAIADKDADGDGVKNGEEADAKSSPGDKQSTPKNPGNWLDISSLIPKEVQSEFPGITSYLPRDATLTAVEIERAKAMGATLSADDENTIYIPVGGDRRPVGTALIAPGSFEGKIFFVLIATDKSLKVTHVTAMHADKVPTVKKSQIFAKFKGMSVTDLPSVTDVKTVDDAITQAVKRGGTLLYVRLKKK